MAWLEDLLLVLLLEGHPVVNVFVADVDTFNWLILLHRVDVFFDNIRLLLSLRTTSWLDHVW